MEAMKRGVPAQAKLGNRNKTGFPCCQQAGSGVALEFCKISLGNWVKGTFLITAFESKTISKLS